MGLRGRIGLGAAVVGIAAVGACSGYVHVEDPGCVSSYEACKRACVDMPTPPEPFGLQTDGFTETCGHRCHVQGQRCERQAREARRAQGAAEPPPSAEPAE